MFRRERIAYKFGLYQPGGAAAELYQFCGTRHSYHNHIFTYLDCHILTYAKT